MLSHVCFAMGLSKCFSIRSIKLRVMSFLRNIMMSGAPLPSIHPSIWETEGESK